MNGAMDILHDQSLPTIELLQSSFPNSKNLMISISTLLDPKYVFLIYAPILFALNKKVGHRMLISLTLTEWANQVLKWLLAGERPYWYVHERANELANMNNATLTSDFSDPVDQIINEPLANLRQFPVTCELGAGSPSGHAMVTATVWYILINSYLNNELPIFNRVKYNSDHNNNQQQQQEKQQVEGRGSDNLAKLSWSMYTLVLVSVSISRVYLACHFPHQCLCGALLGVLVAKFVTDYLPMERLTRGNFVFTTCFMFLSAMTTYAILRSLGVNPLWSVDKGMRWCIKKEYIHLDTTPFFSMMRYLGFCLGAGLAYDSAKITKGVTSSDSRTQDQQVSLFLRRALVATVSILFGQFLLSLPFPKTNLNLFYMISFAMYVIFSYAIAKPIPKLIKQHVKNFSLEHKIKTC